MSTKPPASGTGDSALRLSAWPLPRKVALALAIPLLLAGTLGGLRVQSDLGEASNSSSSARQVTVLRPAVEYLTAAERAMVAAVGGQEVSQTALEKALSDISDAADALVASKESADLTEDQSYQIDAVLDLSQAMRAEDAATLSPGTWVAQLRQLQSGVTQLITTIVNEQINPEPRLELLAQTLSGRFALAMQQALVATERSGDTASLELFSELGVEGAAIDRLAGSLKSNEREVAALRTANAQRFRNVRTGRTDLGGAGAYVDYDSIISTLQDGIDSELETAAAEARTAALINAAVTLAALVAAILLALLVSRLLLDPIRRVREGALAVARERLPEAVARIRAGDDPGEITPIDVTTEEEIGQLARAVDDMHRQAVVLASGEAGLRAQVSQMFVTLSRRNTSLINQQLGLIERLEQDEEDPNRLESLFRLDHLAARMRRTADSLLILADAPTATAVTDGLTVADALQAATSGVQDYQRVSIRSSSPMRVDDSAAADVVHLLTELVDNALTYSPPSSTVTVGAATTTQGAVIEIADAGLGIPTEELDKFNESLGAGGEVTPDTARRMGLFVISRLSQRHGIRTSLRANADGGTTATVRLPVTILPDMAPARPPRTASPVATRVSERRTDRPHADEGTTERVGAQDDRPPALDLRARIDSALGLPVRRPAPEPTSAATTPVTAATASAALESLGSLSVAPSGQDSDVVEPSVLPSDLPARRKPVAEAGPEPAATEAVEPERSEPEAVEAAEPVAIEAVAGEPRGAEPDVVEPERSEPEAVEVAEPVADGPARSRETVERVSGSETVAEEAVLAEAAAVLGAAAAEEAGTAADSAPVPVVVNDSLGGDWTDPGDDGFDTPIFRSLNSAWLSSGDEALPWRSSEIEAGWEMADQVAETPAEPEVSQSGLPVRRPGSRLVPGGVTTPVAPTVRDPEAIRARLAAHASGVSRGRAAATAPAPSKTEAGS